MAGVDMEALAGTVNRLTFGGKNGIDLPVGAPALSDPVELNVSPLGELLVSVYVPQGIALSPLGGAAMLMADGDAVLEEKMPNATSLVGRPIVSGVYVQTTQQARVIVALGDSITDGNRSKPTAPHGWPSALARRLAARSAKKPLAVVNAAIGGNRVLKSSWGLAALARLRPNYRLRALPG